MRGGIMLTDKVIVVTGATGALGHAMVEALLATDARIGIVGGRPARVAQLVEELRAGDRVVGQAADLTDEAQTTNAVSAVVERFGGIDGLIAAAGGFGGGKPVHETTLAEWRQQQEINLTTAFLTCKTIVPHLIQRGAGAVVTIGSRPALHGTPNIASYSVAKGGVVRLTEALAGELKSHDITVNCLLPSTIDTPANRVGASETAIAKWVKPAEIAAVALFLLGPSARIISGAAIPVFGKA
jgi:NAD(P)-dependent dehydrogenase (short-subunit alcohol dehydrogenase family)